MALELNNQGKASLYGLLREVRQTLSDPKNRKDFEDWYRKTYGEEYVWKYQDSSIYQIYSTEDGEIDDL